jgi:hypothetical protein
VRIEAGASKPYQAKGFEKKSLDTTARAGSQKENFALNNTTATPNDDRSYTFHFNAPGKPNNIDVEPGWTMLIRLYAPKSVDAIMAYMENAREMIRVETLDL